MTTTTAHRIDLETGEYLDGPRGEGAPYKIGNRTPFRAVFTWRGQVSHSIGWFENIEQACDAAVARAEVRGWWPREVTRLSHAEYMQGRTRSAM